MTQDEVRALLAYASAIDPRVRRNDSAERSAQTSAWHSLLGRYLFSDARAAVDEHYSRAAADAILPGDVRARCAGRSNWPPAANGGAVLAAIDATVSAERPELHAVPGLTGVALGELPA